MQNKPLGSKSYGSIPHLPGSRLGIGDHHISDGQAYIATVKKRDKNDKIYVQEKLDGSNVSIAKIDGKIYALTRAGYLANTSKYEQHHHFDDLVNDWGNIFNYYLKEGERLCGEWIDQAHGTKYELSHHPLSRFVAFDIIKGNERLIYDEFINRIGFNIPSARTFVYEDFNSVSIEQADKYFGEFGFHGALEQIEGYIWRVERFNKVDFLTKFVRHDKIDGKYLPEKNNGVITWNK